MAKFFLWSQVIALLASVASCSTSLGADLGRAVPKRRSSETDRRMVTIDLSALRPSLPGLVLYNYGEEKTAAPKLVQVDLAALDPQLQPHVIWPQFDQIDLLNERPLDFDSVDAIPYLTGEDSLLAPKRMAKMAAWRATWPDIMSEASDNDIYDFVADSVNDEELMSLQSNLPLAEEVIVPLDWEEEKTNKNSNKRNIFTSRGWSAGGQQKSREKGKIINKQKTKNPPVSYNSPFIPFGSTNWMPGKRKHTRETESEETKEEQLERSRPGKKNVFVSSGWGPGGQHMSGPLRRPSSSSTQRRQNAQPRVRISSQESWSVPRQYWNVPHLLGGHWQ